MTTAKERYEAARLAQKEAQRALFAASDAKADVRVIVKLQHDLDEATKERRRAFEAYMNSDEDAGGTPGSRFKGD